MMHPMTDYRGIFCANSFKELSELLWKQIRLLVELQCEGCDIESSEHLHTCQKLYIEYYLIDKGFLAYFYQLHFDKVFSDISEGIHFGRITRYKKAMLKEEIFTYILERVQTKSLYS